MKPSLKLILVKLLVLSRNLPHLGGLYCSLVRFQGPAMSWLTAACHQIPPNRVSDGTPLAILLSYRVSFAL